VDVIGPMFITNMFSKIYTAIFPLHISAKIPLQFFTEKYFFLLLYLSFSAEFSAIWQQCSGGETVL
jgi:hypothetical protein